MGLLDWIEGVGGLVAAPFTGGATIPLAIKGFGGGVADALKGDDNGATAAGAAGAGVSAATDAAAKNRLEQEKLGLQTAGTNISGQTAFENELLNRATLEEQQRQQNLKTIYQESMAKNPRVSPFDPTGGPNLSPAYMSAIGSMSKDAQTQLANPQQYASSKLPGLAPYQPLDIKNLQAATGTEPGTLSKIGSVAGPSLSTLGMIMKLMGNKAGGTDSLTQDDLDWLMGGGGDTAAQGVGDALSGFEDFA